MEGVLRSRVETATGAVAGANSYNDILINPNVTAQSMNFYWQQTPQVHDISSPEALYKPVFGGLRACWYMACCSFIQHTETTVYFAENAGWVLLHLHKAAAGRYELQRCPRRSLSGVVWCNEDHADQRMTHRMRRRKDVDTYW